MLQTRNGKRTGAAAHVAVEMAEEGLIGREDALLRGDPIAPASFCIQRWIRTRPKL